MTLKAGFIGAGWVAGQHLDALEQIAEAQVVAVTDVDLDRAAEAAARFPGAGAYADYAEMLEDGELDAVWICLPPDQHGEVERSLIERGLPFFVEKPLANDLDTARSILEALEETDLIAAVGYLMRCQPNVRRLRDFLSQQEPIVARGSYICSMPGTPWWRCKEQSGGQIVEQSTHVFDLARYLFGEVESVHCRGRRGLINDVENYTVDDASLCSLRFQSGLLCEITSTCAYELDSEVSVEVFCRRARAKLEKSPFALTISTESETRSYTGEGDAFLAEDEAFVEAVTEGDPSGISSPYADAFQTHRITCAAEKSMEEGRSIALD